MGRKDERSKGTENNTSKISRKQIADAWGEKIKNLPPEKREKEIGKIVKHRMSGEADQN